MSAPNVVVFIPGILGSQLTLGDELVWPGTVWEYLRGYKRMSQLLNPATKAGDIIRRFGPLHQYGTLIEDLQTCGFLEDSSPPTLYVFPYDWRKDNAMAAAQLANQIDEIDSQHQGKARISLIAHSMGGLVARYYLECDRYPTRPGFRAVCQLLTLATPHRGAPLALAAAVGQVSRLFLNESQVKELANSGAYPSLYQLLPMVGEPFTWNEDVNAQYAAMDVYEAETASKLSLSAENLESAQTFRRGLSLSRRPDQIRYFSFFGTELRTPTTIGLLPWREGYRVRQIEGEHAGDKTVPVWSGVIDGIQGYPVGGEHGTIFRDDMLRRLLAGLLGKKGLLAAAPPTLEVLVPDRVVPPETPFEVHLSLPTPVESLHGSIQFLRIPVDATGAEGRPIIVGTPHGIRYNGSAIRRLNLLLKSPAVASFYEAAFVPDGAAGPQASDRFIVQA